MRRPFISERRIVENISTSKWGRIEHDFLVHYEFYNKLKSRGSNFNTGFHLRLYPDDELPSPFACWGSPITPQCISEIVALTVREGTCEPLRIETVGETEAVPHWCFESNIASVHVALENAVGQLRRIRRKQVADAIAGFAEDVLGAPFVRIFEIGGDTCFLICSNHSKPVMPTQSPILLESEGGRIECYFDGPNIVCLDGWLPAAKLPPFDEYFVIE